MRISLSPVGMASTLRCAEPVELGSAGPHKAGGGGLLALLALFRPLFRLVLDALWRPAIAGRAPVSRGVRCSAKQAGIFAYMFPPTAGLVRTGTLAPLPTWRLLPPF